MAEVTVSKQTVVYPAKTARKGFAPSPGIDESFGGHNRAGRLAIDTRSGTRQTEPVVSASLRSSARREDRPTRVTLLERLVMAAHERGHRETFLRLVSLFTDERLTLFDSLLMREESLGRTPLACLGQRAAANTSKAIVAELKKLGFLRGLGAARMGPLGD